MILMRTSDSWWRFSFLNVIYRVSVRLELAYSLDTRLLEHKYLKSRRFEERSSYQLVCSVFCLGPATTHQDASRLSSWLLAYCAAVTAAHAVASPPDAGELSGKDAEGS